MGIEGPKQTEQRNRFMKKAVLLVFTALSFLGVMQNYISATELSDGELTTVISQVKVGEG